MIWLLCTRQMNLAFAKATKWWEKGLQPNMREVESAQDLVDSLTNAGDNLVIVDFFSPGCGGCRALHPKVKIRADEVVQLQLTLHEISAVLKIFYMYFFAQICQIAEQNPDVLFLQVNYEEHKSMCYSLHVHVLPFFRFYRGAQGRVSSFSCTNATVSSSPNYVSATKTPIHSSGLMC